MWYLLKILENLLPSKLIRMDLKRADSKRHKPFRTKRTED